jgi:hypothetical protein
MDRELVSLREFGRRVGVSHVMILKSIKSGRIQKEPDGRIDFHKQIENWGRNRDISKSREPDKKPVEKPKEKPKTDEEISIPQETMHPFAKAKLAKETYTAKLRQIEYESASGKLIEKSLAVSAVQKFGRWIRDSIMTIPDRVAAEEAAGLIDYLKPILVRKCGKQIADEIILEIDLSETGKIVHKSWNKESREVLTSLKEVNAKGLKL